MEELLVEKIRRSQKDIITAFIGGVFGQNTEFFNEIYQEKNFKSLSGKEALEICKKLQEWIKITN